MNQTIKEIVEQMEELEERLKDEIEKQEEKISYEIKEGYIKFEKSILEKQKKMKKGLFTYLAEIPLLHFLTSPFIYVMAIPAVFMDIMLFIYQNVIFRVYGFKFVKRSDYIVFDRQHLKYLNFLEKFYCVYCSYFNGLMHYAAEIASKTELYFCPIKHAKKIVYRNRHYTKYLAYGDEEDYQNKLEVIQESMYKERFKNSEKGKE